MNVRLVPPPSLLTFHQRGLTLVETMVALVISLLLLAGLVTVFAAMNSSFSTSKRLNHLVVEQRLASTVLANTIAGAGYWPLTNRTARDRYRSSIGAFPAMNVSVASATFDFEDGQVIAGSGGTAADALDVVATRMLTAPDGTAINCQGGTNTGGDFEHWVNVFSVDTDKNQLMCTVVTDNGATTSSVPLIGGDRLPVPGEHYGSVESLVAVYGVDTDADGSVDRYMSAQTLNSGAGRLCPAVHSGAGNTSTCWSYVRSLRVTLGFVSAVAPGQTLYLTRNIVLANAIGRYVRPGGGIPMTPPANPGGD